jgi:hypothetical protein
MKISEIEVKVCIIRRELDYWESLVANKRCANCASFENRVCVVAGHVAPPHEVQAVGCPEWAWDQVPF